MAMRKICAAALPLLVRGLETDGGAHRQAIASGSSGNADAILDSTIETDEISRSGTKLAQASVADSQLNEQGEHPVLSSSLVPAYGHQRHRSSHHAEHHSAEYDLQCKLDTCSKNTERLARENAELKSQLLESQDTAQSLKDERVRDLEDQLRYLQGLVNQTPGPGPVTTTPGGTTSTPGGTTSTPGETTRTTSTTSESSLNSCITTSTPGGTTRTTSTSGEASSNSGSTTSTADETTRTTAEPAKVILSIPWRFFWRGQIEIAELFDSEFGEFATEYFFYLAKYQILEGANAISDAFYGDYVVLGSNSDCPWQDQVGQQAELRKYKTLFGYGVMVFSFLDFADYLQENGETFNDKESLEVFRTVTPGVDLKLELNRWQLNKDQNKIECPVFRGCFLYAIGDETISEFTTEAELLELITTATAFTIVRNEKQDFVLSNTTWNVDPFFNPDRSLYGMSPHYDQDFFKILRRNHPMLQVVESNVHFLPNWDSNSQANYETAQKEFERESGGAGEKWWMELGLHDRQEGASDVIADWKFSSLIDPVTNITLTDSKEIRENITLIAGTPEEDWLGLGSQTVLLTLTNDEITPTICKIGQGIRQEGDLCSVRDMEDQCALEPQKAVGPYKAVAFCGPYMHCFVTQAQWQKIDATNVSTYRDFVGRCKVRSTVTYNVKDIRVTLTSPTIPSLCVDFDLTFQWTPDSDRWKTDGFYEGFVNQFGMMPTGGDCLIPSMYQDLDAYDERLSSWGLTSPTPADQGSLDEFDPFGFNPFGFDPFGRQPATFSSPYVASGDTFGGVLCDVAVSPQCKEDPSLPSCPPPGCLPHCKSNQQNPVIISADAGNFTGALADLSLPKDGNFTEPMRRGVLIKMPSFDEKIYGDLKIGQVIIAVGGKKIQGFATIPEPDGSGNPAFGGSNPGNPTNYIWATDVNYTVVVSDQTFCDLITHLEGDEPLIEPLISVGADPCTFSINGQLLSHIWEESKGVLLDRDIRFRSGACGLNATATSCESIWQSCEVQVRGKRLVENIWNVILGSQLACAVLRGEFGVWPTRDCDRLPIPGSFLAKANPPNVP
eukprot:gene836-182_t